MYLFKQGLLRYIYYIVKKGYFHINWFYKSRVLAKRLSRETIRKGDIQQINAPIPNCKVVSELEEITVQMGGDPILVNYNKFRERQYGKDRENNRNEF